MDGSETNKYNYLSIICPPFLQNFGVLNPSFGNFRMTPKNVTKIHVKKFLMRFLKLFYTPPPLQNKNTGYGLGSKEKGLIAFKIRLQVCFA